MHSFSISFPPFILDELPIPDGQDALRHISQFRFMSNHDDGLAHMVQFSKISMISKVDLVSRFPVGSSAMMIAGSLMSARAMATR